MSAPPDFRVIHPVRSGLVGFTGLSEKIGARLREKRENSASTADGAAMRDLRVELRTNIFAQACTLGHHVAHLVCLFGDPVLITSNGSSL